MYNDKIILETIFTVVPKRKIGKIIIYGSQARGTANENSDLDICIVMNDTRNNLPAENVKCYTTTIDNAFLKINHKPITQTIMYPIDDFDDGKKVCSFLDGPSLLNNIHSEGITIYNSTVPLT